MKRLRLMVVRSEKDALLQELAKLGCVEFSELAGEITGSEVEALVHRESSNIMTCKARQASLNHAVELLAKYVPEKGKLLSAKPEQHCEAFLDEAGVGEALQHAKAIESADDRIKRANAEESRQRAVMDSLQPWLSSDIPLDMDGTETCTILLGSVPVRIPLTEVVNALAEVSEEAELFSISADKSQNYVEILCRREIQHAVQECLRTKGFLAASVSGMHGTAKDCLAGCEEELKKLESEKENCKSIIASESTHRKELKFAADKMSTQIALCEAEDKLYGTDSIVVMEGWFPVEKELVLTSLLDRFNCAWDARDPEVAEYPDVPVKLKNGKLSNGLNMVTDMYSLPMYGSVDPNPLMAPFFILFYGLMMADMGYGLLMVLAAVVALKKIKPRDGALSFCQLLLYGGISTFICGALTGGLFGNALEVVGQILGKPEGWGVLPALFNPTKDSIYVLVGAMILGLIHLNTGMVINAVKLIRRGQIADVIWGEGALWVTLLGIVLFALGVGNVSGYPVVLILGIIMILYGGTRSAKGFGKVTSLFGTVYNVATGWFGDILSYARIMALMLAGSVIAQVFNTIGGMAKSFALFIPVFLIGHALNFALNLLGCYVHDLRLQCLEFFGKFYEDGGRAFNPLKVKAKFYNTIEQ